MIPDLSEKFSKMLKKDKEDKTVAEEKVQDMPETEEDVAKKINS